MKNLRPCPFCGGQPRVRRFGNGYVIQCRNCGATGTRKIVQDWHDNKFIAQEQAATAWNQRTEDPIHIQLAPIAVEPVIRLNGHRHTPIPGGGLMITKEEAK